MPHVGEYIGQLWNGILAKLGVTDKLEVGRGTFTARILEVNGSGDTRLLVRDTAANKAVNLSMSHGAAGAGNASLGLEGIGVMLTINGGTNRIGFQNQTTGTGVAVPTLTANKPGADSNVAAWLTLNINGTDYYLPLWS